MSQQSSNPYPIDSFPPVLKNVITTLHEDTQIPVALIGGVVLAAASLACQPLINVISPNRSEPEPCSLYLLTLAESGKGKTTIRDRVMKPFEAFAERMQYEYDELHKDYVRKHRKWLIKRQGLDSKYRKAVKNDEDCTKVESDIEEHELLEPEKPKIMGMFIDDTTPKRFIDDLNEYAYSGIILDEASSFFKGYLKRNLSLLNKAWSGDSYVFSRYNKERIRVTPHLTLLLMIQNDIFIDYYKKHGAQDEAIGFFPRFLFTCISESIENLSVSINHTRSDEALNVMHDKINALLDKQKEQFLSNSPPVNKTLNLSQSATEQWKKHVDYFLIKAQKGLKADCIKSYILRTGSNINRIAAILKQFSPDKSDELTTTDIDKSFELVRWYINQTIFYFYPTSKQYQEDQKIYKLFDWIKNRFLNPHPNDVVNVMNYQTGKPYEIKVQQWQPFKVTHLQYNKVARFESDEKLKNALNILIGLGLIVIITYHPLTALHIARPVLDSFGNQINIMNQAAYFSCIQEKNNTPKPSREYDMERLKW